ncbi:MAG TPA: hypothetical protein VFN19_01965 [Candidatus Nanopelagicales bacterium]|nr:hypothetical protein [Candidatus Nanopelagicales bacterium]
MGAPVRREWRPAFAVDVRRTLGSLRRGRYDPTYRTTADGALWRTMRTPAGPATQRLTTSGDVVVGESWGPGAGWAAERLPAALGAGDDLTGFDAGLHPLVERQWRRVGENLRFPAVGLVLEMLVPSVLEQRVTGLEAKRSWQQLVRSYGEPAPGPAPAGMVVFPEPRTWRAVPSWEWHRAGVEQARSATVLRAAAVASRLEEGVGLPTAAATARLRAVPGIGPWTAAEVAQRAFGDADAVSYGDFHLAPDVVYALTGETDGSDERLAELLAPWAGHRGRVAQLVVGSGITRPRRGPRYAPLDHRGR